MLSQTCGVSKAAFASALSMALLAGSPLAFAQNAAPQNAGDVVAPTAEAKPLSIVCIAASGKVMFKASPEGALTELKAGQALTESSEVFTSLGAIVQIKIGDGQVFTIDRLSRVVIKSAMQSTEGKQGTELQLPYGRVRFDVVSTKVANAVKIESPDATLAVKGTHGVMEKIPGQPTRAYGGELNEGVFNVMLVSGVNVDVKKSQQVTSERLSVAEVAGLKTQVQTVDKASEAGGKTEARWTPAAGALKGQDRRRIAGQSHKRFFPPILFPDGFTPINGDVFVSVDRVRGRTITVIDHGSGPSFDIGHYLVGMRGTPQGAALVMTGEGPSVVVIDDRADPGAVAGTLALRQWDLNTSKWQLVGNLAPLSFVDQNGVRRTSAYNLDGLGNLGGNLYASGFNTPVGGLSEGQTLGHYGVFDLDYSEAGGAFRAQQVMSFPMLRSGGGLTGANDRGTVFAAAQYDLSHGSSPAGVVLLELDPRINFIMNAWSVAEGDLVLSGGTVQPAGSSIGSNFRASGVAYAGGQVVMTGTAGSQTATVSLDVPVSRGTATVARANNGRVGGAIGAGPSNAIAGEGGFNTAASFPIAGAERKTINNPVPGVDPLWLSAGYSRDAAQSRTFRRMIRDTVLSVAVNPSACAASGELNGLNRSVLEYYGQRNGVNSALRHFYSTLPANHPCGYGAPNTFGS